MLRILALLFVIVIHYGDKALPLLTPEKGWAGLVFLRSLSSGAVDIFIIISGFFLCKSESRPIGKPASLLAQVIYRNLMVYGIMIMLGIEIFNLHDCAAKFVPSSYYPILFCTLFIISPWLNLVYRQKQSLQVFIISLIIIFSVWPTLVDLSEELIGLDWFGLSTVGARGAQAGFNIVNFILMYYVGGFLRLGELPQIFKKRGTLILLICFVTIIIFVWAMMVLKYPRREMISAWVYHNPFVLLLSVCLFLFFKDIHFKSLIVNNVAKVTYLCFLIHSGIIAQIDIGIKQACERGLGYLMIHYCLFSISMLVLSGGALLVYNVLIEPLFDKLNRIEIPYRLE